MKLRLNHYVERINPRQRTALALIIGIGLLVGSLYLISSNIMLASFSKLEVEDTRAHVQRARAALEQNLIELARTAQDYAFWDDSYNFMADRNADYIETNMTDASFTNLHLDLLALVDTVGELAFIKAFDWETESERTPPDLGPHLRVDGPLVHAEASRENKSGLLLLPEGPLLVASSPILNSFAEGPARGALLMGRYLDAELIQQTSDIVHLPITVWRADDSALPSDFAAARTTLTGTASGQPAVFPQDSNWVAGYDLIADVYGRPALIFQVIQPRIIYQQGQNAVGYLTAVLLFAGGLFGLATHLLISRLVLARMGHSILLSGIQAPVAALRRDYTVLYCNEAYAALMGHNLEEIQGHNLLQLTPEFRRTNVFQAYVMTFETGRNSNVYEYWNERYLAVQVYPTPWGILSLAEDMTTQKQAEERIERQYHQLAALRAIDNAIMANRELSVTLDVVLYHVTTQLSVDAADILLLDAERGMLDYAAQRGIRSTALNCASVQLGEGHAGRAASERRTVIVPDLRADPGAAARANALMQEGFACYFGVPLVSQNRVLGVLELFHRSPLNPTPEWLEFMQTLGGQAAIAISDAQLFTRLEQTNQELVEAYDATIVGWSRALELRDFETEGHTLRVTELTLRLAERMDIPEDERIHIRRGALLHDIGKIGVPDQILLKPGPLDKGEWVVMRKHPAYAFDMLAPIRALQPALDIPYCHHEHWDGSGYPRGLKGDEIPRSARLFSVVDVWDALTSNRPYRAAWPTAKANAYLQENAGILFDPDVVTAFLKLQAVESAPVPAPGLALPELALAAK